MTMISRASIWAGAALILLFPFLGVPWSVYQSLLPVKPFMEVNRDIGALGPEPQGAYDKFPPGADRFVFGLYSNRAGQLMVQVTASADIQTIIYTEGGTELGGQMIAANSDGSATANLPEAGKYQVHLLHEDSAAETEFQASFELQFQ